MSVQEERARGVEILTEIFESGRISRLKKPRTFNNGFAYYFEATAYERAVDFCLPAEVLEDMQGSKGYRQAALVFARAIDKRLRNANPRASITRSGIPIEVESLWPHEACSGRAASFLRTNVRDLKDNRLAKCFVVVTHQQSMFELKENPFSEFGAIINSVRDTIDEGSLKFYEEHAHPETLQRIDLNLRHRNRQAVKVVETLIEEKVFWLGFKVGTANSQVWLNDPWDSEYLGIAALELLRESEVLEARDMLRLDSSREFGSAGREMLLHAREFESRFRQASTGDTAVEPVSETDWDVFISHASEDKETFVHPLAEGLAKLGLRIWYDTFTLRLGDSLLEKIDHGLRRSRYGIVVLSPSFFQKDWPRKELDGLVALESKERKVVLPIWHNVTRAEVARYSPVLAGRLAVSSSSGLENVISEITKAIT